MQRAVGQERADLLQRGGDVVGERAARPPCNEHDRPHRAREQFQLRVAQDGVTPHDIEAVVARNREHHGERLVGALLAAPQFCDRLDAARVAHEVVAADPLYGDDPPVAQGGDCRVERRVRLQRLLRTGHRVGNLRPAGRAGDGFSMEAAIGRIEILALAVVAERKGRHAGVVAVVRQRLDQRVARAALGAVDEGITVAAIVGVLQLPAAVVAHEIVGGHEDPCLGIGRARGDQEAGIVPRLDLFHAGNDGTR